MVEGDHSYECPDCKCLRRDDRPRSSVLDVSSFCGGPCFRRCPWIASPLARNDIVQPANHIVGAVFRHRPQNPHDVSSFLCILSCAKTHGRQIAAPAVCSVGRGLAPRFIAAPPPSSSPSTHPGQNPIPDAQHALSPFARPCPPAHSPCPPG